MKTLDEFMADKIYELVNLLEIKQEKMIMKKIVFTLLFCVLGCKHPENLLETLEVRFHGNFFYR